jgi:hypothetical protein
MDRSPLQERTLPGAGRARFRRLGTIPPSRAGSDPCEMGPGIVDDQNLALPRTAFYARAMARRVLALAAMWLVWLAATPAGAWIENHALGDDVRITLDRSGKAQIEHRLTLKTNGSEHLKRYLLAGIDPDAELLPNAYAVPERDALSSSLQNAVPLILELLPAKEPSAEATLQIDVDDKKGLWRGSYVLIIRYTTDLRERGLVERDGALVKVAWLGPRFADGFDNARVTFVVPRAPTEPRAVAATDEDDLATSFISEVSRGTERDEIQLLRTYARGDEPIRWSIRVDPRALEPLPTPLAAARLPPSSAEGQPLPDERLLWLGAALLFALSLSLVVGKVVEARRRAADAGAEARPLVPLPLWARAPLAAAMLVAGVGAQLMLDRPVLGASGVAVAAILAMHGGARLGSSIRGPGRWLTVSDDEGLGLPPRPRGACFDTTTLAGKALLTLLLAGLAAAVVFVAKSSWLHGLQLGFDAVFLLAIFGTGRLAALPPDMSLEPARVLRRLVRTLRRRKELRGARIAPRIRVPTGAMDPDELRLRVAPRLPLRGFVAIEVGVSYALGFGARVALPEVLVRVTEGSPCEEALRGVREKGRITPGRRADERVIAFSPRLPTVAMTADIVAALALRLAEPARPPGETPTPAPVEAIPRRRGAARPAA